MMMIMIMIIIMFMIKTLKHKQTNQSRACYLWGLIEATKAKVFEACVESKVSLNVAVRPFSAREIKIL